MTRRGTWAVALAAGVLATVLRITPVFDPDCFWHLETGRWIVAHRAIPWRDPFSHTFAGQRWTYVDALADVLMSALQRAGGWTLLIGAFAAAGGLAVAAATVRARDRVREVSTGGLAVVALLVAATCVFRITPRPQTLTFVLAVATLGVLDRVRTSDRAIAATFAVVALWQNVHASALLGVAAAVAYVAAAWFDRMRGNASERPSRALAACGAAAVGLMATPHPIDRFMAGFAHLGDPRVPRILAEWASVFASPGETLQTGWARAFFVLLALALVGGWPLHDPRRRPVGTADLLVALGWTVAGLRTVRLLPLAALALAPLALAGFERLRGSLRPAIARVAATVLAVGAMALAAMQSRGFGTGIAPGVFPEGAARYVAEARPRGPLYNDFFDGGYLLWSLAGREPVFIDGRAMALYGIGFVTEVFDPPPGHLRVLFERHHVSFAVVNMDARIRDVQAMAGWVVTYLDDRAFVAVREDANPALAARDGFRALHPGSWWNDVDRWRRDPASLAQAQAEADRVVAQSPDAVIAHVLRGAVALASRSPIAEEEVRRARILGPESVPARALAMRLALESGDRGRACEGAAWILARSPRHAGAQRVMSDAACR